MCVCVWTAGCERSRASPTVSEFELFSSCSKSLLIGMHSSCITECEFSHYIIPLIQR